MTNANRTPHEAAANEQLRLLLSTASLGFRHHVDPATFPVLLDRVVLGCEGQLAGLPWSQIPGVIQAILGEPGARQVRNQLNPRQLSVLLPIDAGPLGSIDVQLDLVLAPSTSATKDTVTIAGSSTKIRLNPLRQLHKVMAVPAGPASHGAADNFIGQTDLFGPNALAAQLMLLHAAVEGVVAAMNRALPEGAGALQTPKPPEIWLKAVEACHDAERPADDLMVAVAHTHFPGAAYVDRSRYMASADHGRWSVRYRTSENGFEMKAYAKTPNLLRCEVSCPDRDAVKSLTGLVRAPFTGDGAVSLATEYLSKARDHVAALCGFTELVWRRKLWPLATINKLQPLFETAAGRTLPGREPPSTRRILTAQRAINHILIGGAFACGDPRRTIVRDCLDALAEADGPLVRQGKGAVFALRADRVGWPIAAETAL